ncbi:MAG: excinuclease ABC subunit UvrC [Paracoccaceae bacterium]
MNDNSQNNQFGPKLIKSYLKNLTSGPGVYRMLDENHNPLYVGKARNLRNRVSNYAQYTGNALRIQSMINATHSMMFLTTKNETEALLLEQNLIKQLKPRYNILLRDDKSFPYIFISTEQDFPRIEKHRGEKKRVGRYYGPFASAGAVNRTLNTLQKVFLLRSCTDKEVKAGNRPCLNYHLKRCAGPCGGKISIENYAKLVNEADDFLKGKSRKVHDNLTTQMIYASENMNYELAASFRDRLQAIKKIHTAQGINPKKVSEADIIAVHLEAGNACVQVYFIRSGQNWGNKDYYPKVGTDLSNSDILQAFVGQFYLNRESARLILLSHEVENKLLMEKLLSERLQQSVNIITPKKGEKRDLVLDALRNAQESLVQKMAENATQITLLNATAKALGLEKRPNRIEVYDNSHIQGSHAVGAMIVSGPEGFMRSEYRKFNIRLDEIQNRDDTAMMKHVFTRRFGLGDKNGQNIDQTNLPDLIILDGGKGQLSSISGMLSESGFGSIPILAIAKGPKRNSGQEVFYLRDNTNLQIAKNDSLRYFFQRLRDEAHRFVIGAHRKRRSKALTQTRLDDIPGLGAIRKHNLLMEFGSTKLVSRASIAELSKVHGISRNIAEQIYNYFNQTD